MHKAQKTGRRSPVDSPDRVVASEIAKAYRKALGDPNKSYPLNPEDPQDEWVNVSADDAVPLVQLLENFAKFGTFEDIESPVNVLKLLIRSEFRRRLLSQIESPKLDESKTKSVVIAEVADRYNVSEKLVDSYVKGITIKSLQNIYKST